MRTQEEIVERVKQCRNPNNRSSDFFGFRQEVLIAALDYGHAKPFLKPDATEETWGDAPNEEGLTSDATQYYEFALEKMENHRGISADRSVQKLSEFAWLLGRDDILAAMEAADYPQYGAPKVKAFADGMGLPWPQEEWATNMAAGVPCRPDCEDGCGH